MVFVDAQGEGAEEGRGGGAKDVRRYYFPNGPQMPDLPALRQRFGSTRCSLVDRKRK
jgi:hypothetical protein